MSSQGRQTRRGDSPAFGISIDKHWWTAHRDHSTKFHLPRSSETFLKKAITIVRVANTTSRRIKAIRKLNNIITHPANHHPSILSDKWRRDISQDWHLIATEYHNKDTDLIDGSQDAHFISTLSGRRTTAIHGRNQCRSRGGHGLLLYDV